MGTCMSNRDIDINSIPFEDMCNGDIPLEDRVPGNVAPSTEWRNNNNPTGQNKTVLKSPKRLYISKNSAFTPYEECM